MPTVSTGSSTAKACQHAGRVSDSVTRRSRLLFLCSTGCLSRGSTRRPTRAQPLHGANRHGGNHLQRHGSRPGHQPFDEIECQVGPKIPHDPASFVAGAPPGSAGQKRKWKSPVRRRRGPRKNPCTQLSAHAKYPWFTRSRTFTTKPDGVSVRYFTIGKTSDAFPARPECFLPPP